MKRQAIVVLCLGALAFAPAAAEAGTVTAKGQVVGAAYVAGSKSAVPVLLSQASARKAKLRSPLGIALISRSASIPAPGGSVKPGDLRIGDSFTGRLRTSRALRAAAYPRLTPKGFRVTRRGTTLSNDALYALVAQLRKDLDGLQAYVVSELGRLNGLLTGLTSQATSTRSQLDTVTSTLNSVSSGLTQLQTAIANIPANVQSEIDALTAQVGSLQTTASSLQSQLTTAAGSITTIQGLLSGITTPGQLSGALTDISTLQSQVGTLTGAVSGLTTQINGAGGLQDDVNSLCTDMGLLDVGLPLFGLSLCP
jgi:hypothetical protein